MSSIAKNKVKILPLEKPPITSYPTHAHMLSVSLLNKEALIWFYEYYIQLFARKDISKYCFVDFCTPLPWKSCPWLYFQRVDRKLIMKGWNSIIDFLIDSIDLGNYIFLYLNRFYISTNWAYNRVHDMHDIFIYGYDKQKKMFYIADFNGRSTYSHLEASFSEVEKAFKTVNLSTVDDFLQGAVLISPTEFKGYNPNRNRIITFFKEYYLSIPSYTGYSYSSGYRFDIEQNIHEFCFGMDIYKLLRNYLTLYTQKKTGQDFKGFHVLFDHKSLMLMRIKYLSDIGYLKDSESIYKNFEDIKRKSLILRNLVLKGMISECERSLAHSIELISKIACAEKKVIEDLIANIEGTEPDFQ